MGMYPPIEMIESLDPPRPQRRRGDAGTTLVEIMISIALMGLTVAAVLAAVQTSIRSSSIAFTAAEVETVLLNASDRIARAPQLCEYEKYVDAAAQAGGWETDATSVSVERLAANTGGSGDWVAQTCPADVGPFDVQRLTITATDPSGEITRIRTVVKSDVN